MSTPVLINTLEFAEQSLEIHDKIRASDLPRLQEMLFSDQGEIEYRLEGGHVSRRKLTLRLEVHGVLELMCQRCLDKLTYPVNIERRFELVKNESALPDSELDDDDVDYLVVEPALNVADFVEEEMVLSLPITFRHEFSCASDADVTADRKPNPFQVLERLKAGKKS